MSADGGVDPAAADRTDQAAALGLRFGNCVVRYRVIGGGNAPWLVICHGMALDHRDFLDIATQLAGRWRVLLWDMPGHGTSQPAPASYSLDAMTDALEAVLQAAGVARPVLLGFSFGGLVAQAYARRHPGELAALIAYGCFAPFSQPAPVRRGAVGLTVKLLYGPKPWEQIRDEFAHSAAWSDAGREHVRLAMAPLGRQGFIAMTRALLRSFRRDPGFRLDCPVLIVRGDRDSNGPGLGVAEAALIALQPEAALAVISDAGHCAHLDQPAAFSNAIGKFIEPLGRTAAMASV